MREVNLVALIVFVLLFGFVTWLQYETIFRIHALCPYCMVVWTVTIPMFWYTTLYNLRGGNIKWGKRYPRFSGFLQPARDTLR